ncbi:mediator of RNA polymerase II transcription subunit 1-domain-containing protein [Talaromyces proteolyticus]|uniref:Mediator of RNA polymerase II transcription subunit 1 n=1 Tax=Talaromyces proteolyticus TaxID=1131652 RepID=A0AAD4Q3M5_9EURO|nr:mediator of RNA polymerase II transcription subunit 1-domain-containing protein [Talaromyces proteolyticus]KAH8701933.1 mediator of RNA polymerase II transcription subunit 1-domain-containing protein [Talaromyces proteolyticus]
MATPSSRQNPGATPTHLTSSPHPSAVSMGRGLSHKSPSIKTPSVSGPGHGHQLSASSYQGATPIAATAGLEDPFSFSSPSALLALGSFTGMSPALNVQEGLVGSGMNDNDIQALALGLAGARNHEEERRKNIEEVAQLLRERVSGRGVSREAVERLSQLEGFESIWQENSINIAGNSVDLEIDFYPGEDNVKDVNLSYASFEAEGEGERREEATAVLKADLIQTPEDRENGIWKPLKGFHGNLARLAKLDKLSQEVNCFEAVEGIFESLQKIWEAEGKRDLYRDNYEHLCRGSIGRPSLHRGGRVGMGVEYWIEKHRVLHAKRTKASPDSMAVDGRDECRENSKTRSVTIECEAGYPSLRISKEWVGDEALTVDTSSNESSNSETTLINWMEPPPTLHSSANGLDAGMAGEDTPNRRFVAKLEPPVHVPILTANDIYRLLGLQVPQEYRTTTYDGLLVGGINGNSTSSDSLGSPQRRKTTVLSFNADKTPVQHPHSYSFQAFEAAPGRTIREFPFAHPRQLAAIFPILRQYGLLETLIQRLFPAAKENDQTKLSNGKEPSASNHITVLSNDDPDEKLLDRLLASSGDSTVSEDDAQDVKVDMTLRTQVAQPPLIMLLITIPKARLTRSQTGARKVSINFEIRLNGRIHVTDVSGLGGDNTPQRSKAQQRLSGVLETAEDLGVLVEYVVGLAAQH